MEERLPIRCRAEAVTEQVRLVVKGLPFLADRGWDEVDWGMTGRWAQTAAWWNRCRPEPISAEPHAPAVALEERIHQKRRRRIKKRSRPETL